MYRLGHRLLWTTPSRCHSPSAAWLFPVEPPGALTQVRSTFLLWWRYSVPVSLIFHSSFVLIFKYSSLFVCLDKVYFVVNIISHRINQWFCFVLWTHFMCPFKALEWVYGSLHISQLHSRKDMLGSGCLICIWKLSVHFFLKSWPHGWQENLFNVLMDIIIMLPKILLFL